MTEADRLKLECLFGPEIYRFPAANGREARVRVAVADTPGFPPRGHEEENGRERRRRTIWSNDRRNQLIASIATSLREGKVPKELAADGLDEFVQRGVRVAILAETIEHARQLRRLLPKWKLLHARPDQDEAGLDSVDIVANILTVMRAAACKTIDADVLIRADGGWGDFPVKGFPPRSPELNREVWLVDLNDKFDPTATRLRLRDYAARGWNVVGLDRRKEVSG